MARFWTVGALDPKKKKDKKNSVVDITTSGVKIVTKNTPGVSLLYTSVKSTVNSIKEDGDALNAIAAGVGITPIQKAATDKESSIISRIGRSIIEGFTWLVKLFTLGGGSSLVSMASYASVASIQKYENKRVQNRVKEMAHTNDENQLEKFSENIDANRNGNLSSLEVDIAEDLLDLNKDGSVSKEELAQFGGLDKAGKYVRSKNEVIHDSILYSEDQLKSKLITALGQAGKQVVEDRWQELDLNKDGRVDATEYHRSIDRLDTDGDGLISTQELQAKAGTDGNALFDWIAKNNRGR